jgi:N-acetylneuraminic acid mutarotase
MTYTINSTLRNLQALTADQLSDQPVTCDDGEGTDVGECVYCGGGDEYFQTRSGLVQITLVDGEYEVRKV